MGRPRSEYQYAVAIKIPGEWVTLADELAENLSRPGLTVNRTDVLRMAMAAGLEEMKKEKK